MWNNLLVSDWEPRTGCPGPALILTHSTACLLNPRTPTWGVLLGVPTASSLVWEPVKFVGNSHSPGREGSVVHLGLRPSVPAGQH